MAGLIKQSPVPMADPFQEVILCVQDVCRPAFGTGDQARRPELEQPQIERAARHGWLAGVCVDVPRWAPEFEFDHVH